MWRALLEFHGNGPHWQWWYATGGMPSGVSLCWASGSSDACYNPALSSQSQKPR